MGFVIFLALTTFALAASAAFFSVYGLAQIFTGAFWPVVIMASSLELGKLITASYLYRFWDKITFIMKTYLISATLVLMLITSAGIFGFLSAAYQQDVLPLKLKKQQIELFISEKAELETLKQERLERRREIDTDVSSLPNNYVTGRERLIAAYNTELAQLRQDIALYTEQIRTKTIQISELKSETLQAESHVGPIIFIASAFERDVDDATKWLILLIIFAFDPLAVALTIGTNQALLDRAKTTNSQTDLEDDQGTTLMDMFDESIGGPEPEPTIVDISQLKTPLEYDEKEVTEQRDVHETKPSANIDKKTIVTQRPVGQQKPSTKLYKPHEYRQ